MHAAAKHTRGGLVRGLLPNGVKLPGWVKECCCLLENCSFSIVNAATLFVGESRALVIGRGVHGLTKAEESEWGETRGTVMGFHDVRNSFIAGFADVDPATGAMTVDTSTLRVVTNHVHQFASDPRLFRDTKGRPWMLFTDFDLTRRRHRIKVNPINIDMAHSRVALMGLPSEEQLEANKERDGTDEWTQQHVLCATTHGLDQGDSENAEQKNWAPFQMGGETYVVRRFWPDLEILKVDLDSNSCEPAHINRGTEFAEAMQHVRQRMILRLLAANEQLYPASTSPESVAAYKVALRQLYQMDLDAAVELPQAVAMKTARPQLRASGGSPGVELDDRSALFLIHTVTAKELTPITQCLSERDNEENEFCNRPIDYLHPVSDASHPIDMRPLSYCQFHREYPNVYHMLFVKLTLEANGKFALTHVSPAFVPPARRLSGSKIAFPTSLARRGSDYHITYGDSDRWNAWMTLPVDFVHDEMLQPLDVAKNQADVVRDDPFFIDEALQCWQRRRSQQQESLRQADATAQSGEPSLVIASGAHSTTGSGSGHGDGVARGHIAAHVPHVASSNAADGGGRRSLAAAASIGDVISE